MNAFLQSLRGLGPMRLTAMASVGVGVLAFFVYLMARFASPQMELLYGDLDLADSGQIVNRLQAEKIPYELRRDGTEIWVPKDHKLDLRVRMAEQNLPSGGTVRTGYELFDNGSALGSTSFMQSVNLVRALEGELARTIRAIDGVRSARVHLVMPKREMFSRETQEPSASVVLTMRGNNRLAKQQVLAVQHLIAAAVPKLQPQRISIVDGKGTLLARGTTDGLETLAQSAEEMRLNYENRLARTVEELLERSLGPGRVRAEVSVEMDFDRIATTQELYDPDGQVVRSSVTVEENQQNQEAEPGAVSVAQNLPDANAATGGVRGSSSQNRTQETVNYEISKTIRNHVKELGIVRRLSVAVLVDGNYVTGDGGNRTYEARSAEQIEQIATLVRSAVGYDAGRGDQVDIVNMRFADADAVSATDDENLLFGMERDFIERMASNIGLSVVAILFLLLVLKPLVSRAVESMSAAGSEGRRLLTDQSRAAPALAGPAGNAALGPAPSMTSTDDKLDELIDIDKVEGRVKASSIKKIGEIVEKHPEEALSIIRTWMYQES